MQMKCRKRALHKTEAPSQWSGIGCWMERLLHGQFGVARMNVHPQCYVDDIGATVIAEDLN
eukprot:1966834-Amphidinium_carterae.1